jgi:hypothetical protein
MNISTNSNRVISNYPSFPAGSEKRAIFSLKMVILGENHDFRGKNY